MTHRLAYQTAAHPRTILALCAVAGAAREWSLNVRPQGKSEHVLANALAALSTATNPQGA